jgi:hypothetical protein
MFDWGKSYASYLVANQNKNCVYQAGNVFEDIDDLVSIEGHDVGLGERRA